MRVNSVLYKRFGSQPVGVVETGAPCNANALSTGTPTVRKRRRRADAYACTVRRWQKSSVHGGQTPQTLVFDALCALGFFDITFSS